MPDRELYPTGSFISARNPPSDSLPSIPDPQAYPRFRKGLRLIVAVLCGLAAAFWLGMVTQGTKNDFAVIFTGLAILSVILLAALEFWYQATE